MLGVRREVLILVVVEDGLRAPPNVWKSTSLKRVLILVLVEDGLRALPETDIFISGKS